MTDQTSSAPGARRTVRDRIAIALTTEHYRRAAEQIVASPEGHCSAFTDVVLTALHEIANEMEQTSGQSCAQCATYLTSLTDTVQQSIGKDTCPLCAEYLALKQRAESPEAAAAPLYAAADRPEPTLRERIAAAIYEQNNRIPWATAYPADIECYGSEADAALAVRDAEMEELRRQAELSDTVTAETKVLLERRTATLQERAERAESVTTTALTELADSGPGFARGFRLVHRDGHHLDGAVFPSGRAFVLDDPEYGFATVTVSVAELLRSGYHGARIEWADQTSAYTAALLAGADAIEEQQAVSDRAERAEHGYLDHESELQGTAVRGAAKLLRRMAGPKPAVAAEEPTS